MKLGTILVRPAKTLDPETTPPRIYINPEYRSMSGTTAEPMVFKDRPAALKYAADNNLEGFVPLHLGVHRAKGKKLVAAE